MAFEETPERQEGKIDYDALNKYMVKTCGFEQEKTVVGIISGIVGLGTQKQEDAKMEWSGTKAQEDEEKASMPDTYFETDTEGKRWKRWPVKPVKTIAITIDFPGTIVDKAPFYTDGEDSNPAPLRICMNGTFWRKELKVMDLGRQFSLTLRKNNKTHDKWSLLPNNTIYQMAVGAGIINQGDAFLPQDLPKLLGKALLFKVRVWFNGDFYTEKVSYAAGLVDGMAVPEYDENLLFSVFFDADNTDKEITYLTSPMINRMKMSSDWSGSRVKEQVERVKNWVNTDNEPIEEEQEEDTLIEEDMDSIPF